MSIASLHHVSFAKQVKVLFTIRPHCHVLAYQATIMILHPHSDASHALPPFVVVAHQITHHGA